MNAAETAREIIDLIGYELASLDADGKRILARRILAYVKPLAAIPEEKPEPVKPMSDGEVEAFGEEKMLFGKFAGYPMNCVPVDYIEWLSDASREFWQKCHRYLSSPRVKRERTNDDE